MLDAKNMKDVNSHLPADHPAVPREKIGILLANLGTPDGYDYWSMRRYLNEFLSDRRVIDYSPWKWQPLLQLVILTKRPFTSGAAYKSIWNEAEGESPLMTITKAQTAKITTAMKDRYGDDVVVDFCMRYGNPSTKSKVRSLVEQGCRKILFFPLYPQYAGATTATANDQFFRALISEKWVPEVRTVPAYFARPSYIEALAQSVERAYETAESKPDILVCSYHGVPKRYLLEGDPYHCQCQKTTRLLKERLGWGDTEIVTTFQSRFGPEEWIQPYTDELLEELLSQGKKNILVYSPAFVADCLETTIEIGYEYKEELMEKGAERLDLVPSLNDDPLWVDCIAKIVTNS